jgi:hypothetical protein
VSFTIAYDVTAANFSAAPQGAVLCGYDTGAGIAWAPAMWAAHPGAVHIDQAPDTAALEELLDHAGNLRVTAHAKSDVLDVEFGAVPVGSPLIAAWAKAALASYNTATRPGQRRPLLYQSLSNVGANVKALLDGGVTSGVGLWIADWGISQATAIAMLDTLCGPFPVYGLQVADAGSYDVDLFDTGWLSAVSGNGWVFGPVRHLRAWPGKTTFGVTCYPPAVPEPLPVAMYQVTVCRGPKLTGPPLPHYPVMVTPAKGTSALSYEGHYLPAGSEVTVGVRAVSASREHAGPWATATLQLAA